MTKAKGMERQRVTWPGDPDDTAAQRIEKERKDNELAQKQRAEQQFPGGVLVIAGANQAAAADAAAPTKE